MGLSAKELDVVNSLAFGPPCLAPRFFTAIFDSSTMPFFVGEKMKLVEPRNPDAIPKLRFGAHRDAATVERE